MGEYLAQRIIDGAYTYTFIVSKKPMLKTEIDDYLIKQCRQDLIK
jgi:hypothetical protein